MKRASERLRDWREAQGLTQAEAGARFNTTRMTWHRWEAGEMLPNPAQLAALYREGVAEPNDFYDLPQPQPQPARSLKAVA